MDTHRELALVRGDGQTITHRVKDFIERMKYWFNLWSKIGWKK